MMEALKRTCYARNRKFRLYVLLDFSGWTFKLAGHSALQRKLVTLLLNHYPGTQMRTIIVNARPLFQVAWRLFTQLAPKTTCEKVKFVNLKRASSTSSDTPNHAFSGTSDGDDDLRRVIQGECHIPLSVLPYEYGGAQFQIPCSMGPGEPVFEPSRYVDQLTGEVKENEWDAFLRMPNGKEANVQGRGQEQASSSSSSSRMPVRPEGEEMLLGANRKTRKRTTSTSTSPSSAEAADGTPSAVISGFHHPSAKRHLNRVSPTSTSGSGTAGSGSSGTQMNYMRGRGATDNEEEDEGNLSGSVKQRKWRFLFALIVALASTNLFSRLVFGELSSFNANA
ncbi:unnamed protein product [Amoebophrya sp. A25]|nr:unnamed protein product [Amoebophrya sp. A25]|eukprot:GSA25T00003611001.1